MKDDLNRLESKIDRLDDKLDNVDKTLVKQELNLKEHMRRTEIQEEGLEILKAYMHDEVEPIKDHIKKVSVITKFVIGSISILTTVAGLIYKFIQN